MPCSGVTTIKPRIVSRFGDEGEYRVPAAKMLAMVLHGMQGTPYIYQGEEIGMTNPHFSSISDYRDVESHNMFIERAAQGQSPDELLAILASKSRDNSRTPMPWHDGENGGFSDGEPWIALGNNYREINVEAALADPESVFYTYQQLIALRKTTPVLTWGALSGSAAGPSVAVVLSPPVAGADAGGGRQPEP